MLTDKHCAQINSATITHKYDPESSMCYSIELFEKDTGYENGIDLGGIIVYMQENELLAFYDYERFEGCVFKTSV